MKSHSNFLLSINIFMKNNPLSNMSIEFIAPSKFSFKSSESIGTTLALRKTLSPNELYIRGKVGAAKPTLGRGKIRLFRRFRLLIADLMAHSTAKDPAN